MAANALVMRSGTLAPVMGRADPARAFKAEPAVVERFGFVGHCGNSFVGEQVVRTTFAQPVNVDNSCTDSPVASRRATR